jgi:hypothetical protein
LVITEILDFYLRANCFARMELKDKKTVFETV